MRCPECSVRNSVAARKCVECGKVLPKKSTPMPYIFAGVAVIGLAGAGVMGIGAAITIKKDPQSDLTVVAKRVAGGPKSPADAEKLKADFDKVVKDFLKKEGAKPSDALAKALEAALPSQTFEVHIIELPRGLKIVEIDTMLQASNYLILKNESEIRVVNIPGLEVCDGAQVIRDTTGPVIIAIGHSAGQGARRPQIKVYSLLPDDITDQSDKSVPNIKGEGSAIFAKNNKDVDLDISLYSLGVAENVFQNVSNVASTADDETLKTTLVWNHGKFTGVIPSGRSQLAALYAVARSLKANQVSADNRKYISNAAQQQIAESKSDQDLQPFTLSRIKASSEKRRRRSQTSNNRYGLFSVGASYVVELQPAKPQSGIGWVATSVTKTAGEVIQNAQMGGQPKPNMASHLIPPVVRENVAATVPTKIEDGDNDNEPPRKNAAPIVERRGEKQIPVKVIEDHSQPIKKEPVAVAVATPSKPTEPPKKIEQNKRVEQTPKVEQPKLSSTEPPAKDAPAVPPTVGYIKTSDDPMVRVRRGPSTIYRTVLKLTRGDQVQIIGKKDGWLKVRANGREGFVMENLIGSSKPGEQPTREPSRETERESRHESRRETSQAPRPNNKPTNTRKTQTSSPSHQTVKPHVDEPPSFVP